MKKFRILTTYNTAIDMDVPDEFDLNACGQSVCVMGFFSNGRVFIFQQNIHLMFCWVPEQDPTPPEPRGTLQ